MINYVLLYLCEGQDNFYNAFNAVKDILTVSYTADAEPAGKPDLKLHLQNFYALATKHLGIGMLLER